MNEIQHTYDKKNRSRKLNPKVDYSALVSLSFLLMCFFMLVKSLERLGNLLFALPESHDCCGCFSISYDEFVYKKITLILAGKDKIICYRGNSTLPLEKPNILSYSKESLRKELLYHNKRVQQITDNKNNRLTVIIKPTSKCSYGNFIDVLDEMNIVKPRTYVVIDDFSKEEIKMLAMK